MREGAGARRAVTTSFLRHPLVASGAAASGDDAERSVLSGGSAASKSFYGTFVDAETAAAVRSLIVESAAVSPESSAATAPPAPEDGAREDFDGGNFNGADASETLWRQVPTLAGCARTGASFQGVAIPIVVVRRFSVECGVGWVADAAGRGGSSPEPLLLVPLAEDFGHD